jgi:hypothetical protein
MTTEIRSFSLWLEGEFDSIVNENPGVSPDQKYVDAYEAAKARGCTCTICDDTGLGADDVGGPVIAVVHPDGEVTDATGTHQFYATERASSMKTRVKVVVLCTNAEGAPEFHTCTPEVTPTQIKEGEHYERARENAEHNGYEGPFIAFDATDAAGEMMAEVAKWLQSP